MSTFLELCNDLKREAGISGSAMTAVTNQTGEFARVVEWILTADEKVQNIHPTWDFLRTEFSFNTIASTGNYTTSAVSLTELGAWKTDSLRFYLTSAGVAGQQDISYVPWNEFRDTYTKGSLSTQTGQPLVFTVKPNKSVTFWPIPNDIYTITGEYFKRAQTMAAATDEPLIPQEFQDAIVWRALMLYGAYAAASEKYSHGQNEYRESLAKLELDQLPEMLLADPLA